MFSDSGQHNLARQTPAVCQTCKATPMTSPTLCEKGTSDSLQLPSETTQFLLKPTVQLTTPPNKNNYPHPFSQPTEPTICVFFCLELMDNGYLCVCVCVCVCHSFNRSINQSINVLFYVCSQQVNIRPTHPRPPENKCVCVSLHNCTVGGWAWNVWVLLYLSVVVVFFSLFLLNVMILLFLLIMHSTTVLYLHISFFTVYSAIYI